MFGRAVCCETHFYKLLALQCINTKQKNPVATHSLFHNFLLLLYRIWQGIVLQISRTIMERVALPFHTLQDLSVLQDAS